MAKFTPPQQNPHPLIDHQKIRHTLHLCQYDGLLGNWAKYNGFCRALFAVVVCLSVCLSQVGIISKRLHESSWFCGCGRQASFHLSHTVIRNKKLSYRRGTAQKIGWFGVVRGHSMSPFDRAHMTSYSTLIETMCPSFAVFEIQPVICRKSLILTGDAENARHELAGHENAAPFCRGGKCETCICGTKLQGWKLRDMKMRETRQYGTPSVVYVCPLPSRSA